MRERKKRNIMTEFQIDEISGVDNPAQKGAKVAIMKRDSLFGEDTVEAEERLDAIRQDIFEALRERARLAANSMRQLEEIRGRVTNEYSANPEHVGLRALIVEIDQRLTTLRSQRASQAQQEAAATFKSEPSLDEQLERLRANPSQHAATMLKIRCERDFGRLMRKSDDWETSPEYERIDAVQREADAYMAYSA